MTVALVAGLCVLAYMIAVNVLPFMVGVEAVLCEATDPRHRCRITFLYSAFFVRCTIYSKDRDFRFPVFRKHQRTDRFQIKPDERPKNRLECI